MKVLKTSIEEFDEKIIHEAINVLARGGVILYPTDTVYGLGANIFNNKAVRRVFEIKKRSFLKPLSITKVSLKQKEYMSNYLPGPYTFILKKQKIIPRVITSGSSYVGVRVPDNKLACSLASIFPITTTSANLSDDEVLDNPGEILDQLDCEVDLVIDVGDLNSNKPSSVIDLTGFEPKIIRK